MKKFFLNNLGLKILSVVVGVVMWVLVVNALDPVTNFTISRVPVVLENTEAVTGLDKVYNVISGGTVNITVQAKKTDQARITAADFLVTADMSMAYGSNPERQAVNLNVRVVNNNNIIEGWSLGTNTTLMFSTEDIISREYRVEIEPSGELSDSYRLSDLAADPGTVTVRGPQSAMASVSRVVVRPDITPLTPETPEVTAAPIILNGNGAQVTNPDLTMNAEAVTVYASLYHTKTVPVAFGGTNGEAAAGYRYTGYQMDVSNVVVQGSRSDLANINRIDIPATELGISGAVSNMTFTVDLRSLLPDNVSLVEGEPTSVIVTVMIEKLETKTLQIPTSRVSIEGMDRELEYSIAQNNLAVTVVGLKTDLDVLTQDMVTVSVNADGLGAGYYTLTANVGLPSGYSLNAPVSLGLRVIAPEPSTEETPAVTTPEETDRPSSSQTETTGEEPSTEESTEEPTSEEEEESGQQQTEEPTEEVTEPATEPEPTTEEQTSEEL